MAHASTKQRGPFPAPETSDRRQLTFSDVALVLFYSSTVAIAMGGWIWFLCRLSWTVVEWFGSEAV
jgi:hypothetical protein